jgi:hypothetical protein
MLSCGPVRPRGRERDQLVEPHGISITAQFISRAHLRLRGGLRGARSRRSAGEPRRAASITFEGNRVRSPASGWWALRRADQDEKRQPAGLLSRIYEATLLHQHHQRAARQLAGIFEMDPGNFAPIRSVPYGYEGTLAFFDPNRLDRIETVTPVDRNKTMGRFFARQGPSLYMFYAEARDTVALRERLIEHAPSAWTGVLEGAAPDNLFVHPKVLHGALLGVSRESVAWTWSGHPERGRRPKARQAERAASRSRSPYDLVAAHVPSARKFRSAALHHEANATRSTTRSRGESGPLATALARVWRDGGGAPAGTHPRRSGQARPRAALTLLRRAGRLADGRALETRHQALDAAAREALRLLPVHVEHVHGQRVELGDPRVRALERDQPRLVEQQLAEAHVTPALVLLEEGLELGRPGGARLAVALPSISTATGAARRRQF